MSARSRRVTRLLAGLFAASSLWTACGDEEACSPPVLSSDTECRTSRDCFDEGFLSLRCVSGRCALPCVVDEDCTLTVSQECVQQQGAPPTAVCERQLCQPACPESPCLEGQVCHRGRCVISVEDFELRPQQTVGSLERFGWNQLPTELDNPNVRLVEQGPEGCTVGRDACAGVAASGERFAVLGTQPTTEKGTATLGPTCRPCACCLECTVAGTDTMYSTAGNILEQCPFSSFVPAPLSCPVAPPECASVCSACSQCADGPSQRVDQGSLVSCELSAAQKICPSCPVCQDEQCRECREGPCSGACESDLDAQACRDCEMQQCAVCASCRTCEVCGEAVDCEVTDPNAAACRARRLECDALGAEGCYPTPLRYDRSELTPLEQSLVSPEYDLSGRSGNIIVSFAYVPFRVGQSYFESRQGVPAGMWQAERQELLVELCAGGCTDPSAWRLGTLVDGGEARLPPEGRRNNGLTLGQQSPVDWRSGRVQVSVPAEMRTSTFRVRFRPRLASDARVGLDDLRLEIMP